MNSYKIEKTEHINFDWSNVPIFRHASRKAQFLPVFQDKVGKIRILTGTLVYKARVDKFFVFIDKLISEQLADLIWRSRFCTTERRDKCQFFLFEKGSKLIQGVLDPVDFIF